MNWKKIGINLIYPHLAVIFCLLPISVAFLVLSLIFLDSTSLIAIISYLLSYYVLLVICFRIPRIVEFCKTIKRENKYLKKWFSDVHLRINISLYASLVWNIAFAIFQLFLGFYHNSFWFYSMFAYYVMLGVMRFFLVKHTRKFKANQESEIETKKYIFSGWLLLSINLALAVIVVFMVFFDKTFYHGMIITIAMAAYTFLTFTFAIINLIKYRKYKSPVYSAAKCISLIAGCVSMLTLETTMLTTFGNTESPLFRKILLLSTGVAVIGFAIIFAIFMIVKGSKQLSILRNSVKNNQVIDNKETKIDNQIEESIDE